MRALALGLTFVLGCGSMAAAQTTPPTTAPKHLAFPTAEGFGANAVGGRGGRVIYVTNLNDSGPGSLREAVTATGPRNVVFAVSGTIQLQTRLTIREPFLTIAGQTAPGDGICLSGQDTLIQSHDVIVRHIRFRPGDILPGEKDALSIVDGVNVIIDHCSATWSIDEALSTTKGSNGVTVQWCIIAEALHNSQHAKGNHGYGGIMQGEAITYHHNLYAHNRSRNPRPQSGYSDFRNNVIYDWNGMAGYAEDNTFRFNYVNNYLKPGPGTVSDRNIAFHTGKTKAQMYSSGNVLEGVNKPGEDDKALIKVRNGGVMVEKPFDFPAIKMDSAEVAYQRVLENVGATLPKRDAVDARIIATVRDGTGKLLDSQKEVGGWPELKSQPAPADADKDGLPDAWEAKYQLSSSDASDQAKDADGDRYTNLEEYFNGTDPLKKD
jgi:pectate lyase